MQVRADEAADREDGVAGVQDSSIADQSVIWCARCGIPYATTMTHCSLCGAPLADEPDPFTNAPPVAQPAATVSTLPERQPVAEVGEIASGLPSLATTTIHTSGGLIGRIRQRPQAMSDDEVDAAAAAIIARARAEERLAGDNPLTPQTLDLLPSLLPDPATEAALQRRRDHDRIWLIVGFVCCVVLIFVALAISRYTSGGLLAR